MNVSEAIRYKRAVRQFQDRPVDTDTINKILNAGRRSQSSSNQQAWQFIVVQNKATLNALSVLGHGTGHLAGAAFAVASWDVVSFIYS